MEFQYGGEMRDIWRNTGGESGSLVFNFFWFRKRGEQTGLDTLVVHAVNDSARC